MSEKWNNYFCNVNGRFASIALDLSLASRAPLPQKTVLLWVWVYLRFPRPDGLTTNAEFSSLSAIEEALTAALQEACAAIEVGRITTDARREFYFYGKSDSRFREAVDKTMNRFPQYKFDFGWKPDSHWNQYFDVLYPSKEDMQRMKNADVLDVLQKHGDTLTSVRDVVHWVYFRQMADRDRYAARAQELGYRIVDKCSIDEGDRRFCLQVCRSQNVVSESINESVIELLRLAEEFDAEYDGWETQVVSVKN